MTKIEIQKLDNSEIEKITEIHQSSLPEDFLPSLGRDFLLQIFYPAILASQNAQTFVACQDDSPIGFVVVSLNSGSLLKEIVFFRFFLFLKFLFKYAFLSLNHLGMIFGIFLSSFSSFGEKNFGEIYIIAMDQTYRGSGVGKLLVNRSMEYLKDHSASGIKIKTLKENKLWISFFIKNGWQISSEFSIDNKRYVFISRKF